jgi:hypothetical protein
MCYKIKQYIDQLRDQVCIKQSKIELKEIDLSSLSFLSKSNQSAQGNTTSQNETQEFPPEYLAQSNLVIGMNGQPIKKYLGDIEKKLGRSLSSI